MVTCFWYIENHKRTTGSVSEKTREVEEEMERAKTQIELTYYGGYAMTLEDHWLCGSDRTNPLQGILEEGHIQKGLLDELRNYASSHEVRPETLVGVVLIKTVDPNAKDILDRHTNYAGMDYLFTEKEYLDSFSQKP